MSFAIRDFYLNGGSQAVIVRLVNVPVPVAAGSGAAGTGTAGSEATGTGTAGTGATGSGTAGSGATGVAQLVLPTAAAAPDDKLTLVASSPGQWGNHLQAIVDTKNTRDKGKSKMLFNLTVVEVDDQRQVVQSERFLNLSIDKTDPQYAPRQLQQSSSLVRVVGTDPNWVVPKAIPNNTALFVVDENGNLKLDDKKQPTSTSGPGVPFVVGDDGKPIDSKGKPVDDPKNAISTIGQSGADSQAAGGGGVLLAGTDFFPPNGPEKTGVMALEKADIFNILCIPPYTNQSDVDQTVIDQAVKYCETRRAIFLVDPPLDWKSPKDAIAGVDARVSARSSNSALFFPRLVEANPLLNNQLQSFVPCGAVAGIFARTDTQRGVWKAPAGIDATFVGVSDLSVHLTDDENGQLNPIAINCLRSFPIVGRVVWGSRTARGADVLSDDYKYIPVRRLALYIEESLFRGTKWVVFEPNDEPLWAQIRLNVGAFMQTLFRQGAFQGTTPRDAYFVKCDKETTTQNDINLGIVNIVVGFAPLKPAEFVVIKLQQIAGEIQT